MDKFELKKIIVYKNKIMYEYNFSGKWCDLLTTNKFFCEYDFDLKNVPESILVIPLLCNLLPISWVFNLNIKINEVDENFFNCIEDIKRGYQNMFPKIEMNGNINVKKILKNTYNPQKNGTLFSGGVDAFNTLFQHISEKPVLLTVWGADVKLDDEDGWNKTKKHSIDTASQFGLDFSFVKSNFRTFINYKNLSKYVRRFVNDEWWHGFQHGIGILGLMSPIAYIKKFNNIYIASSFTSEYKGKYTCASDPTIDNYLKFSSCKVIHDGYNFNRQDKIKNICDFVEKNNVKNIELKVCWENNGGNNCCECEKCCRTILGLLVEGKDPNNFGFNFTNEKRRKLRKNIKRYAKYSSSRYSCIQKRLCEKFSVKNTPKDLLKFRNLKIKVAKPIFIKVLEKLIRLPYKFVKFVFKKVHNDKNNV